MALSSDAARSYIENIPAIFGKGCATKCLVALCVNGPGKFGELSRLSGVTGSAVDYAMKRLSALGIVAKSRSGRPIYYLNPEHPAENQLRTLCRKLGDRWPPPAWPINRAGMVRVPMPKPVPSNVFGHAATSRALMLIFATNGVGVSEITRLLNITSSEKTTKALERFVTAEILTAERIPWKNYEDVTRNSIVYRVNDEYFAHEALRSFVTNLTRNVYPDIFGLAQAIGRRSGKGLRGQYAPTLR